MDFRFLILVLFYFSKFPLTHTSSCQDLSPAKKVWKELTSPGFPQKFASQTQCNWIIRAPQGYRVELMFESFYLVGGVLQGCFSQLLKITDLYSRVTDGPYCGNTLPPEVVSTGQSLRITLESNALGRGFHYEGFKAQYRQTRKPSSIRFRDTNGQWRYYNVQEGEVSIITTTTAPKAASRSPNEVDDNNNAAIDAQNNVKNHQEINNNERVNVRNNENNAPPTQDLPNPPPTRKRNSPTRTPAKTIVSQRIPIAKDNNPQNQNSLINQLNRPGSSSRNLVIRNNEDDDSSGGLSSNGIIGIAIGVIMIILIVILLVFYILRKRRRRTKEQLPKSKDNFIRKPPKNFQSEKTSDHKYIRHHTRDHSRNNQRRHQKTNKDHYLPGATQRSHASMSSHSNRHRSRDRRERSKEHRDHRTLK